MDATILSTDSAFPSHKTLKRFFTQCGFHVEIAHDRLQWLAKARSLMPEVVVIDLDASWGGDAAVATFWSQVHRGAGVPAVFVLGNAPSVALARRTGISRSACFQKPVAMERLLDGVGLAMARIDLNRRTGQAKSRHRRPVQPGRMERCLCMSFPKRVHDAFFNEHVTAAAPFACETRTSRIPLE